MTKFYANHAQIKTLIDSRDDVAACRATMAAALKAANGRTLVVPKMWGGFLPHVLKTTDGIEVIARDDFNAARAEALAAARETRVGRMFPGYKGDSDTVVSTDEVEQHRKNKAAYAARRDARRQQLAAECQARKGRTTGSGEGGKNGGRKKARAS